MGLVVVISLPLIFFCLLLGFGCYFLGKSRGRREIHTNPQVYGAPAPPPGAIISAASSPPLSPCTKPDNSHNV
ncbi:BnaC05g25270D [Brassica napus]|uniref:Transmembrane protein n=2 Tax=Brassica TaxID=3705 RepID=A0A0D3CF60_BRAOL|nr:PREDICTED: uncharacterized protein LOC106293733 [Brassica oleracea var. oleracea]XP_013720752.1 uncharacterized protein BNAC05G25270D [Brassica napus]CAF1929033.1 unnamed protein product [Brassica napus]CDY49543.1 BnaC05g25270D [Brassica napus]